SRRPATCARGCHACLLGQVLTDQIFRRAKPAPRGVAAAGILWPGRVAFPLLVLAIESVSGRGRAIDLRNPAVVTGKSDGAFGFPAHATKRVRPHKSFFVRCS